LTPANLREDYQSFRVQGEDLIIHLRESRLMLTHQLGLEGAIAVTRRENLDITKLTFEPFGCRAVAGIALC